MRRKIGLSALSMLLMSSCFGVGLTAFAAGKNELVEIPDFVPDNLPAPLAEVPFVETTPKIPLQAAPSLQIKSVARKDKIPNPFETKSSKEQVEQLESLAAAADAETGLDFSNINEFPKAPVQDVAETSAPVAEKMKQVADNSVHDIPNPFEQNFATIEPQETPSADNQVATKLPYIDPAPKAKKTKSRNNRKFEATIENLFTADEDNPLLNGDTFAFEDSLLAQSDDEYRGLEITDASMGLDPVDPQLLSELESLSASYQAVLNPVTGDNCLRALSEVSKSSQAQVATCQDNYLDSQPAPELVVVKNANNQKTAPYAITKNTISERDYNMYCLVSGECPNIQQAALSGKDFDQKASALPVGLDLGDIESSVREYNKYCAISGKCPGMFSTGTKEAKKSLTYNDAANYAKWLSKQTGHTYRLPTKIEWLSALESEHHKICENWQGSNVLTNNMQLSRFDVALERSTPAEWVWLDSEAGVLGSRSKGSDACELTLKRVAANTKENGAGFRLVREITSN